MRIADFGLTVNYQRLVVIKKIKVKYTFQDVYIHSIVFPHERKSFEGQFYARHNGVNLIACFGSLCTCLFAFCSNRILRNKIKSCIG